GARPAFPRSSWDKTILPRFFLLRQLNTIRHNWMVYRTMRNLVASDGPFDCVLAPTVTIHHVVGFGLLAATVAPRRMKRLVLFFRNSIGAYLASGELKISRVKGTIWRIAFRVMRRQVVMGRITLATDSPRLAKEYRLLAGASLEVFPQPGFMVR